MGFSKYEDDMGFGVSHDFDISPNDSVENKNDSSPNEQTQVEKPVNGFTFEDYCDTDYNKIEPEILEDYGHLNNSDSASSSSSENREPWAGAKFLLTPVAFVVNFAATQLATLKNAVLNRLEANHSQSEEDVHELESSGSSKKITALSSSAKKPFTNQNKVLEEVGASPDENGICSPMANLYFEEQLGYRDGSFRVGTAQHIYEEALKEKQHQIDLIHQGKDGLHAVFVDHGIPYEKKEVNSSVGENEERVEALLKDYDQVLITYPVIQEDGEKDRHQIYVKKMDDSRCSRFDVNKEGGVDEMPCRMFYHKLAKKIAKAHVDHDDKAEVIIAGIKR
ncbi:hypothetical protein D7217_14545 [Legionella pneumophila]|uniref:hypothetical protein n=1 Tax=Legionella pneumophila TaxID=446 RepID=UPI0010224F84|nr:hypothetical protein [Legionella pneumophila]RYW86804.1 hypothetical protein D7217_14545 [Legionella pneumophila]HAU1190251.1 hypothetical protein [Legionella pneumophila]HBP6861744.1 hypothetical protein [Legionella pneumophila]